MDRGAEVVNVDSYLTRTRRSLSVCPPSVRITKQTWSKDVLFDTDRLKLGWPGVWELGGAGAFGSGSAAAWPSAAAAMCFVSLVPESEAAVRCDQDDFTRGARSSSTGRSRS